ncbi:MAG: hypothetical protein AB7I35_08125 [Ramlibacter sp.]
MTRYKPQEHNSLLLPVVLSEQIVSDSFASALNYLVDHEYAVDLYSMVHNIEKLAKTDLGRRARRSGSDRALSCY